LIILDTHTLIWLDAGLDKLGSRARGHLDKALQQSALAVSAISFWEAAMLVVKGRIRLNIEAERWRSELLTKGLLEHPVTGHIGIRAASLPDFHGDPADRLIVATALAHNATLATADQAILNWKGTLPCIDATR